MALQIIDLEKKIDIINAETTRLHEVRNKIYALMRTKKDMIGVGQKETELENDPDYISINDIKGLNENKVWIL